MLKRKGFKISIIIGAILLLLITMPEICVDGARNGLLLWFETILPTLFPFFVVTRMIIELDLCPQFLRPYYPIFVGLLSGYPTGALTLNEMILRGQISRKRGQILLVLCNNASPVFLISYVACSALHINNQKYLIWFCVILASTITTIFL